MTACGARGNFPIMFNGSLWTVNPNTSPITISNNPDYRNWGHTYFYQNTRLNYLSMPARGELDFMQPFFNYYDRFQALNRGRAKAWHGAATEGQFNNEMTTTFGLLPRRHLRLQPRRLAELVYLQPMGRRGHHLARPRTARPAARCLRPLRRHRLPAKQDRALRDGPVPLHRNPLSGTRRRQDQHDPGPLGRNFLEHHQLDARGRRHERRARPPAGPARRLLTPAQAAAFAATKAMTPDLPVQTINSQDRVRAGPGIHQLPPECRGTRTLRHLPVPALRHRPSQPPDGDRYLRANHPQPTTTSNPSSSAARPMSTASPAGSKRRWPRPCSV